VSSKPYVVLGRDELFLTLLARATDLHELVVADRLREAERHPVFELALAHDEPGLEQLEPTRDDGFVGLAPAALHGERGRDLRATMSTILGELGALEIDLEIEEVARESRDRELLVRGDRERREGASHLRVDVGVEGELAALDRAPLHELILHAEDRRDGVGVAHQRATLVRHAEEARDEVAEEGRALAEHLAHRLGLHARALARAVRDEACVRLGRQARELREEARVERSERVGTEEVVEAQAVRCERRDRRGAHGARTIRSAPHPAITAREFDHASSRARRVGIAGPGEPCESRAS
jgi:hypothetical protein